MKLEGYEQVQCEVIADGFIQGASPLEQATGFRELRISPVIVMEERKLRSRVVHDMTFGGSKSERGEEWRRRTASRGSHLDSIIRKE